MISKKGWVCGSWSKIQLLDQNPPTIRRVLGLLLDSVATILKLIILFHKEAHIFILSLGPPKYKADLISKGPSCCYTAFFFSASFYILNTLES